MKGTEQVKTISQEWKELPADLREKYETKARVDRERYAREMELWSAKIYGGGEEQISKLQKLSSKKKK